MKKLLFIIFILIYSLSISAFAAAGETLIYSADAKRGFYNDGLTESAADADEEDKNGEWRSNNDRVYKTVGYDRGRAFDFVFWTMANRKADTPKSSGLNPGEDMYVEIVPQSGSINVPVDDYDGITLRCEIMWSLAGSDRRFLYDPDFTVAIKVNGGDEWIYGDESIAVVSDTPCAGFMFINGSTTYYGVSFSVETGNIKALTKSGDRITALRVYPYGRGTADRGGLFMVKQLCLAGYDKYTEPQKSFVDIDVPYVRQAVADDMNLAGSVEWKTENPIAFKVGNAVGKLSYPTDSVIRGLMYTSGGYVRGTAEELMANIDENGFYKNSAETTLKNAIGTICSSAVAGAYRKFMTTDIMYTGAIIANADEKNGYILAGGLGQYYIHGETAGSMIARVNDKNKIFEGYAALDIGDFIVNDGHTRLAVSRAEVVYNGSEIDGERSSVRFTESAGSIKKVTDAATRQVYLSSWRTNYTYTFAELYESGYLPYTMTAYITGQVSAPVVGLYGCDDTAAVKTDGFYGVVASNYNLVTVRASVYNADGSELYSETKYTNKRAYDLYYDFRKLNMKISADLNKESYRYIVTAEVGPLTKEGDTLKVYTLLDTGTAQPSQGTAATTSADAAAATDTVTSATVINTKATAAASEETHEPFPAAVTAVLLLSAAALAAAVVIIYKRRKVK